MKASKVASVVASLLATDAKPTEAQILAAILHAADAKGGKDEFPDKKEKAEDADNTDPEKTNDEFPDEKDDKKAKDKACDEDDVDAMDDEQPKVTEKGNAGKETSMDKKGMDAAIQTAIRANDALHSARRDVESVIGVVAYDSAADVYKAALVKLGVGVDGVDASAYPVLFKLARDKADRATPVMGSDAAAVSAMAGAIKGYGRLK